MIQAAGDKRERRAVSKTTVALTIGLYFLGLLVVSLWLKLQEPFATLTALDTAAVAGIVGRASGLFLMSGLIPFIVWTYNRYRAEKALGPIIGMVAIGTVLAILNVAGSTVDRADKVEKWTSNLQIRGKDRDDFIRFTKQGCTKTQQQNPLTAQLGITLQQISVYCDCYASAIIGVITVDEVKYVALNGSPPASLQEKIDQFAPTCSRSAFPSSPALSPTVPRSAPLPGRSDPSPRGIY